MASIEQQWQAEQAIKAIVFGYAEALDGGDLQRVGEFFRHGQLRSEGSDDARVGAEGVIASYRASIQLYDGSPRTKHVTTNLHTELDDGGTAASARSYFTVLQSFPDFPMQPIISGRYHDTFGLIEDRWCLTDRCTYIDQVGDLSRHLRPEVVEMMNAAAG